MRRVAFAIVGTIAGLVGLLSFKTHSASVANPPAAVSTTDPNTSGATPNTGSAPSVPSVPGSSTNSLTGDVADTRWGPVQVRITVTNGKLTDVTAVEYPNENPRDQEINSYAIPALNREALAAGSAKIDMISGATYTSQGYLESLQSALDKAGLK
jgi:uncharacterized protein with FMN-binding domain